MEEVMARVCQGAQTGSGSKKVDIHTIPDLALRVVLHTITRAAGSQTPHEATKAQLLLASECMSPLLFDWATAVTINMKRQLTKCKQGKLKQFGYGPILVSFILERLPIFQGQGAAVASPIPREPRMVRWAALMPRSGGGQQMSWRPEFFRWLRRQLIVVEDWPYSGTDFTGDPDLPLPEGDDWDEELGKTSYFLFYVYMFFC